MEENGMQGFLSLRRKYLVKNGNGGRSVSRIFAQKLELLAHVQLQSLIQAEIGFISNVFNRNLKVVLNGQYLPVQLLHSLHSRPHVLGLLLLQLLHNPVLTTINILTITILHSPADAG